MSLRELYLNLRANSAASGHVQSCGLRGGARIAVLVEAAAETLTIARMGQPPSVTEEYVFRKHCGVPKWAVRTPASGYTKKEHEGREYLACAYKWRIVDQADMFGDTKG